MSKSTIRQIYQYIILQGTSRQSNAITAVIIVRYNIRDTCMSPLLVEPRSGYETIVYVCMYVCLCVRPR